MFDPEKINPVKQLVSEAKSVAILLPPEPSADMVGAGLALHLSFQQKGVFSQIGCGSQIKVENADLFGVDQIRSTIGNQNLLISFDFKEENLKKVDYDVDENGKFTLLIQPQPGTPPPDANSVNYSYSGASADLVFILGVNSLEELGRLYADEKSFLDNATKIGITVSHRPVNFATHDLSLSQASCLSEIVAVILKETGLTPNPDASSNLLSTIHSETKQFTGNKMSADTFELVAFLMRNGGTLPNSSPFSTSSRFGSFPPPSPSFGASPFANSPFGSPPINPPMFDDEPLPPDPVSPVPNNWNKPAKIFRSGRNGRPNGNRNHGQNRGGNRPGGQGMSPGSSL